MKFPEGLFYTETHEWVKDEGSQLTAALIVGIGRVVKATKLEGSIRGNLVLNGDQDLADLFKT